MPTIRNGTHDGPPLVTLERPDGALLDVYEWAELPAALSRAIGPAPAPPVLSLGILDTAQRDVTTEDGRTVLVPERRQVQSADGLDSALAAVYRARVDAWIARAQVLTQIVLRILETHP